MNNRAINIAFLSLLIAGIFSAAVSCSRSIVGSGGIDGSILPESEIASIESPAVEFDEGAQKISGVPSLADGARNSPNPEQWQPSERTPSVAGVDFASNRFVVIFENDPIPIATAQYLGNLTLTGGDADAVRATDNAPLVQHDFYRKVSANLADKYGLDIFTRVFYRGLNYAVYRVSVDDVAQLDEIMLRVLRENVGLVREVRYDVFVKAVGVVTDTETGKESGAGAIDYGESDYCETRIKDTGNPAGMKYLPEFIDAEDVQSSGRLGRKGRFGAVVGKFVGGKSLDRSVSAAPNACARR